MQIPKPYPKVTYLESLGDVDQILSSWCLLLVENHWLSDLKSVPKLIQHSYRLNPHILESSLLNSSWPNILSLYWTFFLVFKQIAFQNCSLNYSKVLFPSLSCMVLLRTIEMVVLPLYKFLFLFYRSGYLCNWLLLLFSYQVISDSFVTSWTVAH